MTSRKLSRGGELDGLAGEVVLGLAVWVVIVAGCGGGRTPVTPSPQPPASVSVPVPTPTVVLGRPTDSSIAASVKGEPGSEVYLEYGVAPAGYTGTTTPATVAANGLVQFTMRGLLPNTRYYYRARYRSGASGSYLAAAERSFHTWRLSGETFTFVVQADPHMDANSSAAVYSQTLANELADVPDFMFDLGDTSMAEKCAIDGTNLCATGSPASAESVWARNALMRSYFDLVCHSVPLFMVLGNHDGEAGWSSAAAGSQAYGWALAARTAFFANPEPDRFYSGNIDTLPGIGPLQDYYAFEWGDALFVVLDPFTYTTRKPTADLWGWTLGEAQYAWLARTLAASRARFKFVFCHHLLGGNGKDTRGGAAFAPYYEWGGRSPDGSWGFDTRRPGWPAPIHRLFVEHDVAIWFHGHDHFYAREQLDGVVYQEVPQPSQSRYDNPDPGGDYGYLGAVGLNIFPSSGHLRVTVGPAEVRVDYVRSVAPADVSETRRNGATIASYVLR